MQQSPARLGSTFLLAAADRGSESHGRYDRSYETRFLGGANGHPRGAYLPFGGGRRICVGAGFAQLEATLLAAMIIQRFRLDLAPGTRVTPEATVTLRPRGGLPMTLHRRARRGPD